MSFAIPRRALIGAAAALPFAPALALAAPLRLKFELHAAFFSAETHQMPPIDPQVFVADPKAKAGIGPQGIHHAAGFRPALLEGPRDIGAYNALGAPLGFTIGQWFAATGALAIAPAGAGASIACRFANLRPNGVYSLFENHFDQKPVGFTPLDGTGEHNSFIAEADGRASVTVRAPAKPIHANAVLLVYHSDSHDHGLERGQIGVNAHHQLIARLPT